jgi:hypothetical protein
MRDTIDMAREWLSKAYRDEDVGGVPKFTKYNMEVAFAAGAAAEREACAKVCDSLEEQCEKLLVPDEKWPTPSDCAHIIRARGNT